MPDPTAPIVNIPLLRKAVEWAEVEAAKPAIEREWVQSSWISDALNVAWVAFDDTPYEELSHSELRRLAERVAPHCGTAYCIAGYIGQSLDARYAENDTVDGVHVSEFAAAALGITKAQADGSGNLFGANNTIEDVRRIAEQIAGERL